MWLLWICTHTGGRNFQVMSPHVLLSFCPKMKLLALSEMVMGVGVGVGWLGRAPWAADFARIWISAGKARWVSHLTHD